MFQENISKILTDVTVNVVIMVVVILRNWIGVMAILLYNKRHAG